MQPDTQITGEAFGADPAFVASPSSPQAVSTKGFNPGERFDPYNPVHRAARIAWEDANFERIRGIQFRPCLPLSVGCFNASGQPKGAGWTF